MARKQCEDPFVETFQSGKYDQRRERLEVAKNGKMRDGEGKGGGKRKREMGRGGRGNRHRM